jgi:pentalenene oxygenase
MAVATSVPGPAWYEIVSNAVEFRKAPLTFLQDLQQKYGAFAHFRLGPLHAYLITNPQDIAVVMSQPDLFYKDKVTRSIIKPFFGDGLGLSNGKVHKRNRKMVAPAFYHSRLKLYAKVMSEYVEAMVGSWQEDQEIQLEPAMTDLTLRIIA